MSLEELVSEMKAMVAGFARIEQATGEQSDTLGQVGAVQQQLDAITQDNAAAVNRAADHVRALQSRVDAINAKISEFQAEPRAGTGDPEDYLPPPREDGAGASSQAAA